MRELLDFDAEGWRVLRHAVPPRCCHRCGNIIALSPLTAPPGESATFAALAHVVAARYNEYQPLSRQIADIAASGLVVKRSRVTGWIVRAITLLAEVAEEIRSRGRNMPLICAVNAPIDRRQDSGRLWVYLADARRWDGAGPPLVWYRFTSQRRGAHADGELAEYAGALQVQPHAGYNRLCARDDIAEIGCWMAVRRRALDILRVRNVALAAVVFEHAEALLGIEQSIRGDSAEERRAARRARAAPILERLHSALERERPAVAPRSPLGDLVADMLERWPVLTRFTHDGRIEIDTTAAEQLLRPLITGRGSWVFGRSNDDGKRSAAIYTIIDTCKLNQVDPRAYLAWALPRLAAPSRPPLRDLMPWSNQGHD